MAKKKESIKTTAVISEKNGICIGSREHTLRFNKFHVADGDMSFLRDVVDEKSLVQLTLLYPGVQNDKFPPIAVECGIKNYKLGKDADTPQFVNMKFSDNQIIQLRHIMEAAEEMDIEIKRLQGTFDFVEEAEEE